MNMLRDHYGIEQFFVPTLHSESNGQVVRFHSTFLEISRCIHQQQQIQDPIDFLMLATSKYNNTYYPFCHKFQTNRRHTFFLYGGTTWKTWN